MRVVPVVTTALRVGGAVPFALRDASGTLLLTAGTVIENEAMRQQLIARGIYVDMVDSDNFQKALAGKLNSMVQQNVSLGRIAQAKVELLQAAAGAADAAPKPPQSLASAAAQAAAVPMGPTPPSVQAVTTPPVPLRRPTDPVGAWEGIALRAGALLHDPPAIDFRAKLHRLDQDMMDLLQADPDAGLMTLIQNAIGEVHQYSVNHALLVSAVCELAARELPDWQADWQTPLRCAALTMNIAMTALQDQLARQDGVLTDRQRQQVDGHAQAGAAQLATLGVDQPLWLEAVAHHHISAPGPLNLLPPALRLARLIQRADIFAARLSPRKLRAALSATAAAKAAYLDEEQKPDESGAAIIKAMGLYPPGSYVQLASNELAVVLRRGLRANEPRVASIIGRSGTPLGEPTVRDTRLRAFEVKASVAPKEVRVRFPLARLLQIAG